MTSNKIISENKLNNLLVNFREGRKKIILCHGVFDLLHIGHIKYLEKSKSFGDILIVSLTADTYVNKGPDRPIFTSDLRAQALAALEIVNYVLVNNNPTAVDLIKALKPDIYVKDIEYKHNNDNRFKKEYEAVISSGGVVEFTNEAKFESSNIINKISYEPHVVKYLEKLKNKYTIDGIINYINNTSKYKVLVIGDLIIDEYYFGNHLGKMRRESIAEFMVDYSEKYIGGSGIISNHVSSFVNEVDLLTLIGDREQQKSFINKNLNKNINQILFEKKDSPTSLKKRYVEENVGYRNLFKVSHMNDRELDNKTTQKINSKLKKILPKYDLVIVVDFGHGMINQSFIETLTKYSNYLCVNTQINTENKGYNTIDKYPRVDYGCINKDELCLVNKTKYEKSHIMISNIMNNNTIYKLAVTQGYNGCTTIEKNGEIFETPAFTTDALDSLGAGDAFYGITSPLAKLNIPMDLIGFIGCVVGAINIKYVGNQKIVNKAEVIQYAQSLLK